MTNKTIPQLDGLSNFASDDLLHIIDVSAADPKDRKITISDLTANEAHIGLVELATTAEAQAGTDTARAVTPQSLAMFSGRVKSVEAYGAVGDGVTDDTDEINWAWEAMTANGALIFEAGKTYAISSTLLFNDNTHYCVIQGNGAKITMNSGTGLPMLNLAGSAYTKVYNLNLSSPSNTSPPAVGLLLGRTAVFHGGRQAFYSCTFSGYFTFSAYYNVGSEASTFIDCTFENYRNGGHAAYISNDDSQSLLGVSAGQLTGWYFGCIFHCFGTGGNNIHLQGTVADHVFVGCYGVPSIGGHFIHCMGGAGADNITNLTVDNVRCENNAGDNSDTRFFYNTGCSVQNSTFKNISWNCNVGTASLDPDYIFELDGDGTNTTAMNGCKFYLSANGFGKKALLINSGAYLTDCSFWGVDAPDGTKQVTVESGANIIRCDFWWQNGRYPFDATPASTNLVQFCRDMKLNVAGLVDLTGATPSVGGGKYFRFNNSGSTTVTAFADGVIGQEIYITNANGNTTLDLSGTYLFGNSGVDYTLAVTDMVHAYTSDGVYWFCDLIKG